MSSVNDWIVRDYLEALGFLVRQPRKYQVVARSKGAHEEVDLLALNPLVKSSTPFPEEMLWGARELAQVHSLITTVRGWHSEKFTAAMLASSPEVYRFAEVDSVRSAAAELGVENPAKVLCLADLPTDSDQRTESLEFLRSRGIDGVILFRPMLLELAERIDVKKTYEKSDLLQIMRILKNYGLLRSGQMDLFRQTRRRRPSAPKPDRADDVPLPDNDDDSPEAES